MNDYNNILVISKLCCILRHERRSTYLLTYLLTNYTVTQKNQLGQ